MTNNEKFDSFDSFESFESFKQSLIDRNERDYGDEARAEYGEKAVDESNVHLKNISPEKYNESERLRVQMEQALKTAFDIGDPAGESAQIACDLHRQWLSIFYPKYSKEYHKGLGEIYVADERFRVNYDKLAPGCTEFLRDAINIYCQASAWTMSFYTLSEMERKRIKVEIADAVKH